MKLVATASILCPAFVFEKPCKWVIQLFGMKLPHLLDEFTFIKDDTIPYAIPYS